MARVVRCHMYVDRASSTSSCKCLLVQIYCALHCSHQALEQFWGSNVSENSREICVHKFSGHMQEKVGSIQWLPGHLWHQVSFHESFIIRLTCKTGTISFGFVFFSDIEDLTHKTGNFKQFSIFISMLESAIKQVRYQCLCSIAHVDWASRQSIN